MMLVRKARGNTGGRDGSSAGRRIHVKLGFGVSAALQTVCSSALGSSYSTRASRSCTGLECISLCASKDIRVK